MADIVREFQNGVYHSRITFSVSQDISANTSTVTVSKVEFYTESTQAGVLRCDGYIHLDGSDVATMTNDNSVATYATVNNSWASVSGSGLQMSNRTFSHNNDGTKSLTITWYYKIYTYGYAQWPVDQVVITGTLDLPTIPRVSDISAGGVELGSAMAITIGRKNSSFTDTVTWVCGSESGTIASQTGSTSLNWTPEVSLASQNTSGTTVGVTLTVTTYNGSTSIGSKSITVTCSIPASVVPSISIEISDIYSQHILNVSQITVTSTAAGIYGSTVSDIAVTCGSLSGSGESVTFVPAESGTVAITATVTDSRGRTASVSQEITVLPYGMPTVTLISVGRCLEDGTADPLGNFAKVSWTASATDIQDSSFSYQIRRRDHNGTGDVTTDTGITSREASADTIIEASADYAFDISVIATDSFYSTESESMYLPLGFVLIDFDKDSKSVGIGMRANEGDTLGINLNVNLQDHEISGITRITIGATELTESQLQALLALI